MARLSYRNKHHEGMGGGISICVGRGVRENSRNTEGGCHPVFNNLSILPCLLRQPASLRPLAYRGWGGKCFTQIGIHLLGHLVEIRRKPRRITGECIKPS